MINSFIKKCVHCNERKEVAKVRTFSRDNTDKLGCMWENRHPAEEGVCFRERLKTPKGNRRRHNSHYIELVIPKDPI